jgi:hypothetical protein
VPEFRDNIPDFGRFTLKTNAFLVKFQGKNGLERHSGLLNRFWINALSLFRDAVEQSGKIAPPFPSGL